MNGICDPNAPKEGCKVDFRTRGKGDIISDNVAINAGLLEKSDTKLAVLGISFAFIFADWLVVLLN